MDNDRLIAQISQREDASVEKVASHKMKSSPMMARMQQRADELRKKTAYELADILLYLIRFADLSGIDLEKVALEKIEINRNKYPIEKSKGNDRKYTEL